MPRKPANSGIPKTAKNPKGAGRPSKMSETTLQKLKDAFSMDCTIAEACYYAEISEATYYNWSSANPKLHDEMQRHRNNPILSSRQTIMKAIESDPVFAWKYLEKKRKSEFGQQIDITSGGEKISPIIIDFPTIMNGDGTRTETD